LIKDIITYPTPPSVEYATNVRFFNDGLFTLIEDLKDTIKANKLNGLARDIPLAQVVNWEI